MNPFEWGPFFVIVFVDGKPHVEPFVGMGALDAAERYADEKRYGWSEVHLCTPIEPCGCNSLAIRLNRHRAGCSLWALLTGYDAGV